MSSPFIYNQGGAPYQYQQTPYCYTPRSTYTPFIPDASLYPSSPYSNPNSLPPSPNHGSGPLPGPSGPNRYAFPTSGYEVNYTPAWDTYHRERRPSWHAPPEFPTPSGYYRRHSFGTSQPPPQFSNWSQFHGAPSPNVVFQQSQFHINPWLNAESPRGDFLFDLSTTFFSPLRFYGPGQSTLLSTDEMVQPATHPPLTRMRIVCDLIPQWPIDLQLDPYTSGGMSPNPYQYPPPISLQDVLIAVHRAMHKQIRHSDWAKLTNKQEIAISKAYTKRCRAVPSTAEYERAQGVKRVDYLLEQTRMVGLVRAGMVDGWEVMRLVVR